MILILAKEERVEEVLKARSEEGGGRRRSENIFVFWEFDAGSEIGELDDLLGELDALKGGELGSRWLSRLRNVEPTRNLDCEPLRSRETEFRFLLVPEVGRCSIPHNQRINLLFYFDLFLSPLIADAVFHVRRNPVFPTMARFVLPLVST
jgi:hypothetical protein